MADSGGIGSAFGLSGAAQIVSKVVGEIVGTVNGTGKDAASNVLPSRRSSN